MMELKDRINIDHLHEIEYGSEQVQMFINFCMQNYKQPFLKFENDAELHFKLIELAKTGFEVDLIFSFYGISGVVYDYNYMDSTNVYLQFINTYHEGWVISSTEFDIKGNIIKTTQYLHKIANLKVVEIE